MPSVTPLVTTLRSFLSLFGKYESLPSWILDVGLRLFMILCSVSLFGPIHLSLWRCLSQLCWLNILWKISRRSLPSKLLYTGEKMAELVQLPLVTPCGLFQLAPWCLKGQLECILGSDPELIEPQGFSRLLSFCWNNLGVCSSPRLFCPVCFDKMRAIDSNQRVSYDSRCSV